MNVELTLEEIRGDVLAELIDKGYPRRSAQAAANVVTATNFTEAFKQALNWLAQSAHLIAVQDKKPKTEKPKTEPARMCSQNCGRPVRAHNQSGVCNHCRAKAKATGHPLPKIIVDKPRPKLERFALQVTEAQLDGYLTKLDVDLKRLLVSLPIDLKLTIANHFLANESSLTEQL